MQDRKFKIHCLISWTYFFFQNLAIFNSKCEITKITGHQVCCRRVHIHRVGSAAKLYKNTHTTEPKYKRNICNYTMPLRLGYLWSLSQTKIKGVFSFCDILRNQPRDYRQKSQKWSDLEMVCCFKNCPDQLFDIVIEKNFENEARLTIYKILKSLEWFVCRVKGQNNSQNK